MVAIPETIEKQKNQKTEYMAFRDFTTQQLTNTFKLQRVPNCSILQEWLDMPIEIDEKIKSKLEHLRDKLNIYGPYYNEDELKWKFISPLTLLVDYDSPNYNTFVERKIEAEIEGKNLKGFVDYMIATGEFEPEAPFFCLHEYKKEKGSADDPVAQLLSAMLVTQKINNNGKPVYGTYVIGRLWFFVVLNEKDYCISSGHIGSNDDIFEIYGILVNLKKIIEEKLL